MKEIPTGSVTFLFTGIEGSTKLAQELPDLYRTILEKNNVILKESIESHNGFIFKKTSDTFCVSFSKTTEAVNAAVDILRKLNSEIKDSNTINFRTGIHKGVAVYVNGDYEGYITLSRVQRLMSIANGGQILITQEAYNALNDNPDIRIAFKDFGKRKLKDIVQSEHVYQILADGIPSDFPPLKSLDERKNNLPFELNSFIGKEKEIDEIKKILSRVRLLTLIGFGGTGKTRLSVHVAYNLIDEFSNGVWFVELAQLSDPSYVLREITTSLKIPVDEKRKTIDILIDFLRDKELLLILDNCEHLINECARVTEVLLQRCPKIKIIVTSRESLHILGETIYQVSALSIPDVTDSHTLESLSQYESVRLFIDRVLAVKHDFKVTNENAPAVAQLCFQLDGIPLAIELAAARVKVLPVEKILERLTDRFSLLTGGKRNLLPRQQTLRALIDWSYDLLSEKEKLLCRRLSIFSGGYTLEAAEKVCSDDIIDEFEILDLITNLSDKSLVKVTETRYNMRYTMLETIKKYCEEKLSDPDERIKLQKRHFDYFFKFAENSEAHLTGMDQREWIIRIAAENENLRNSLRWSLSFNPEFSLKMSVVMGKFWELRSHFSEGLEFLRNGLESSENVDLIWKAKAVYWTGFFLIHQGKYEAAKQNLNDSLNIFREINNKEGEAVTLISLSTIAVFENDFENLNLYSSESLSISFEIDNKPFIARNLQNFGLGLMQRGDHDEARIKIEESISLFRELNDTLQLAKSIGNIGALEYLSGNYEKAKSALEESLLLRRELGDRQGISIALTNLGSIAYMLKDFDESERLLEECLEIIREIGDRRIYVTPVSTLGSIANDKDDYPKAIKMYTESIIISNELGDKYTIAKGFEGFASILVKLKKYKKGCLMAAKYISLLESSNKNIIEGELTRIEEIKAELRKNLSVEDFEKYWSEGEAMSVEHALEYGSSILKS